ncbi:MAG: nucleoside deaminase [bacterium]|nr:nucleoside deaminase [bacterium]
MKKDNVYIRRCIELSKKSLDNGELPFGSLIVKRGRIIAESENRTKKDGDITSHAEMVVVKKTQKVLGTQNLSDCTIYCSTEPCPMCSFMIRELKFKKVVFAVRSPIMGGFSNFKILQDKRLEKIKNFYTKPPLIIGPIFEEEASKVWDEWRKKENEPKVSL